MDAKVRIVLLVPLLAVGVVSFVIVRNQQGEGSTLIARQRQAQVLTPAKVAGVVRLSPDNVNGPRGKAATCAAIGSGELHNPWRCTISYPDGTVDQYRVTINTGGSYSGDQRVVYSGHTTSRPGGEIRGCCVPVP